VFKNPIFEYGGINNAGGADPYIVSLANTSSTASEVKLFNAQQNLTLENQGLPDGVVANAESIFEMPTAQTFSCYSFAPLIGFPAGTTFSLRLAVSGLVPQFSLIQNLVTFTNKTLVGAFSGIINFDFVKPNRAQFRNLSATAEGDFQVLRFVFSVTDLAVTKGQDIVAIRAENTGTGCVDDFPLVTTQTGFNSNNSSNASTYQEILQTTNFTPFGVDSLVLQSPKLTALAENPVFLTEVDANGNRQQQQIALLRSPYMRPNQRVFSYIKEINGATEIDFTLPPSTTATLFIYDKYRTML